jgi:hypothetical protein
MQVNAIRVADDGSLTELATTHLPQRGWNIRTLPLDDHRFAVVSRGSIGEIVDTSDL